jgi:hypothetical protein
MIREILAQNVSTWGGREGKTTTQELRTKGMGKYTGGKKEGKEIMVQKAI